jgi:hypothetical protein
MSLSRPIYETAADVDREREVAEWVGARWRCHVRKNPRLYPVDYCALRDGAVVGWIEVKCRNYTRAQIESWGGYLMGATKVAGMANLIAVSKRPAVLCVNLAGEVFRMNYDPAAIFRTEFRGRVDRRDPDDLEPCVMFPMDQFKFLGRMNDQ